MKKLENLQNSQQLAESKPNMDYKFSTSEQKMNINQSNNLNNTKYLIDDTMGNSNNSLFFSNCSNLKNAMIQNKLNNTQNLLNDRNSIFSQDKLLISNISQQSKFREKYKDLLPEINFNSSVNTNNNVSSNNNTNNNKESTQIKIRDNFHRLISTNIANSNALFNNNNNNNFQSNNDNFYKENNVNIKSQAFSGINISNPSIANNTQAFFISGNSRKSKPSIIENIKEENENIETINLNDNDTLNNVTNLNNIQLNTVNTEGNDDRKTTNLYCLTNSNIENKFYSSILETNEYFKNNKPEKDENIQEEIKKQSPINLGDKRFADHKIDEEYELEKLKNQKFLEDLKNLPLKNGINKLNRDENTANNKNYAGVNNPQIKENANLNHDNLITNRTNINNNFNNNSHETARKDIISFRGNTIYTNNNYNNNQDYNSSRNYPHNAKFQSKFLII